VRELLWLMRARFGSGAAGVAINLPPRLDSVSPSSGVTAGGTTLTLSGNNFDGRPMAVTVGGVAATSVARVSSTQATCVSPAGVAGAVDVAISTPGGTATKAGAFLYLASAPTVTGVSPSTGPTAGGQSVTITGTSFTGATSVTFGGVPATSVIVVGPTSITCVTPAGAAGLQTVAVTTPSGTGSNGSVYTYVAAPTVSSVTPSIGPLAGAQAVTITGTNFVGVTSVTFGGAAATSVVVVGPTSITCVTPAGSAGAASVAVTATGGSGANGSAYTYQAAPTVTSVTPDAGRSNQTQSVTITGTDFTGATAVTFGGVAATSVSVVGPTSITCTTPTGTAGATSVQVTTPAGSGSASAYFYLDSSSLELWYRPDMGLSQSGNRVSAWNNQSGSSDTNRNLSQGTGANQPRYSATNASFNNKPTIGTSTSTDEDFYMDSGTFAASFSATCTVYHVFRMPSGYANNTALRWGSATYANAPSFVLDTGGTSYQSNDGANLLSVSAGFTTNTVYVVCSVYNGASGATYVSRYNTAGATGDAGSTTPNFLHTGTIPGFASRFEEAEIIAFSSAHGSAKRQEIMNYLGSRYGVSITA